MPDDSGIVITVAGGFVFSPALGSSTCPILEKGLTGDGPISWSYPFTPFQDHLPGRHAHVSVSDALGEIQTGRIVLRDPPDTSCEGQCQITARGYYESLTDRHFDHSTQLGPVYEAVVIGPLNQNNIHGEVGAGTSLAHTDAEAVSYAVGQLGSSVSVGAVSGGAVLGNTENFIGRTCLDVVNAMSAQAGGLATPYVPSVKRGVFSYQPLDLGARYQVTIGEGVTFAPKDDASRLYNHVIVLWNGGGGGPQAEPYPPVISYDQIPTIVDLVVNAGTEVHDRPTAQRLAEGLYGRMQALEFGWSGQLTIGPDAQLLGSGLPIDPWRMDAQKMMRMVNLDAAGRYGASIPDVMLVTHVRWDGPNNTTTVDLGEIRDPSKTMVSVIRKTMAMATSRSIWGGMEKNLSEPLRDNDKAPQMGPGAVTAPADLVDSHSNPIPNPIDHGLVAVAPAQNTVHPDVLPPQPPATVIGIPFWDEAAGFKNPPVPVFPMQIDSWEMHCNVNATVVINLKRLSDNALVVQVHLTAEMNKTQVLTPASNPNLKIAHNDSIYPEIVTPDANTAIKWLVVFLRQSRLYPGYKGGQSGAAVKGVA